MRTHTSNRPLRPIVVTDMRGWQKHDVRAICAKHWHVEDSEAMRLHVKKARTTLEV